MQRNTNDPLNTRNLIIGLVVAVVLWAAFIGLQALIGIPW